MGGTAGGGAEPRLTSGGEAATADPKVASAKPLPYVTHTATPLADRLSLRGAPG
jgi:hypothetical protein